MKINELKNFDIIYHFITETPGDTYQVFVLNWPQSCPSWQTVQSGLLGGSQSV